MARATTKVRVARRADLPRLRDIERAAGEAFRDIGMAAIADDEPLSVEASEAYVRDGRAWVAADSADRAVAYLLIDVVDGVGHVEQVSVHPSHARRGLGRELLDQAASWAHEHGYAALTLTTFADVAWNAPYYERLGFRVVTPEEWGAGLRRVRKHEAELGLDRWPRVAMTREVNAEEGPAMRVWWSGVTIDCLDVELVAEFWSELLGRERGPSQEGWVYLGCRGDGLPRLVFQPVTEPQVGKVRLHLDIECDDIAAGVAEVERLGGRATGERHDYPGEGVVLVMQDPEGQEFCLTQIFT